MENTTTRISDLPIGDTLPVNAMSYSANIPQQNAPSRSSIEGGLPTNYIPMNIHPNPYGNPAQPQLMQNPQQTSAPQNQFQQVSLPPPQSQYLTEDQQANLQNLSHQRLPSRDISQDTTSYAQDEQIQPNYIPRSKPSSDYVREYEDMTEKNMREYEQKKHNQNRFDQILSEIQTPVFIMFLFFFFQMPIVNTVVFKRFAFLSIYNNDGNFNFYGLLFKSFLFGAAYYITIKGVNFLSEI
jgi:hypothetical protein